MASYNNRQKKSSSSFSIFSIFKSRRSNKKVDNYTWEAEAESAAATNSVWRSDEDRGIFRVAEPGIDRKASAFIAKFHETRVSESERHAIKQSA